jgi:hypothetical protein
LFYRYDQDRGDRFGGSRITNPTFDQRQQPWEYDPELGITLTILIEAETAAAANAEAESIGIDFTPKNISVWGFEIVTQNWGTPPPMLHRWVKVTDDEHGFDEEAEALGDSDEYTLFNPWEVDQEFHGWPVFVHYANENFIGWAAHVAWRSEYDSRPVE